MNNLKIIQSGAAQVASPAAKQSVPKRKTPRDFERKFSDNPQEAARLRAEALSSAFMRIPNFKVEAARDLLDLGFRQIYQLAGRAPDSLYEELCALRPETPPERRSHLRLAVYVAETPEPDRARLHPAAWL
ncbi:MAG: helix-hairpin-helix domain-containing protein [Puniceicoccales bacterium]|nr:helix-hairpin-helix domain-containing protein [Puniceicoccales bacterium]